MIFYTAVSVEIDACGETPVIDGLGEAGIETTALASGFLFAYT